MKKTLFSYFALLALIACENEVFETDVVLQPQAVVADSFYVSYETALQYAARVLDEGDSTAVTRASVRSVADHYEYVANKATRSAGEAEVRFHVINYEDNQGYALVSADSRTTPVYAYSTTGNINIDDAVENTGFGDFMDAATDYYIAELETAETPASTITPVLPTPVDTIFELPIEVIDGVIYFVKSEEYSETNPKGILIETEWKQNWPYNYYCGERNNSSSYGYRNPAGCGPIAASQVMSYYMYPSSYGECVFEWNKILASYRYNDVYPNISDNAKAAAYFINKVGVAANALYSVDSSVTNSDISSLLRKMGYLFSGLSSYSITNVISSLDNSYPIIVSGLNSNSEGHMWVVDAYRRFLLKKIYYYESVPHNIYKVKTIQMSMYTHCNWGYGNDKNSNTCWCLNVFDSPYGAFNVDVKMFYNIRPNK